MKYSFIILLIFLTIAKSANAAPEKYVFDKDHTTILFFVNHLGFSDKIGKFNDYDGYFIFDQEAPEKSSVDIHLKPTGIDTFSTELNKILQEKSWFNSKAYPDIHFKSTKITVTGKNQADILGWLSFLGKEKPVTLHAIFNKYGVHPVTKKYVAGFSADSVINRSQFGMNNYVPFVGENVRLHIELEGIRQQ